MSGSKDEPQDVVELSQGAHLPLISKRLTVVHLRAITLAMHGNSGIC